MSDLKRLASRAESEEGSRAAAAALPDLAAADGLLDVAVGTMTSPIGELMVVVTPRGLVGVVFESEGYRDEVLGRIAREISPRILPSAKGTDAWRRELDEYFVAKRTRFDLRVDRRLIRGIARDVLQQTSKIPYGEVSTYGKIAGKIGHPTAARAVGRALGSNPIPIVIPCHRVIGASGALTGYAGGIDRKVRLLQLEGSVLPGLAR
ncbi:MAG: methylated-DNA--[protein]-cysteine S-methyltransferase [Actinomycetota bacterium]